MANINKIVLYEVLARVVAGFIIPSLVAGIMSDFDVEFMLSGAFGGILGIIMFDIVSRVHIETFAFSMVVIIPLMVVLRDNLT